MIWMLLGWGCSTTTVDTGFELQLDEPLLEPDSGVMDDSGHSEDSAVEDLSDALELIGKWEDVFGDSHHVTETSWQNPTGIFHIQVYSNDEGRLIALNDANNSFNANKYSVFEWLESDGQKFLCQSGLEAETIEDAESIQADRSNLENGCRGQGWKRYRPRIPISGQYLDQSSLPVQINSFRWNWGLNTHHVVDFSYEESRVMARNDQNNAFFPNQWSQLAWIHNENGTWICLVVSGAESLEAASAVDADTETPLQGCNGGAWTQLMVQITSENGG